jgi:hypothetical protein
VPAAGFADVDVIRPGPLVRLAEEVEVGRLGNWDEEVADPLERLDVELAPVNRGDRDLQVEDRLRG